MAEDDRKEQEAMDTARKQEEEQKKQAGNWLARIRQEKIDREERVANERNERQKRLQKLLDSDSEDDEKAFDYKGTVGDNLKDFLTKIENHVHAEQKILDAWHEQDVDITPQKKKK